MKRILTDEEKAWLIEHKDVHPRSILAEHLGISATSLFRHFKKLGVEVSDKYSCRTPQEKIEQVIALYPDHTRSEISEITGVPGSTISRIAKLRGLKHNDVYEQRVKDKYRANIAKSHNPECYKMQAATRQKIHRLESFRVRSGLPQKTKMRVSVLPNRVLAAMNRLYHYYNYDYAVDKAVMYYDEETRRSPRAEEYHAKKYGLKFEEIV